MRRRARLGRDPRISQTPAAARGSCGRLRWGERIRSIGPPTTQTPAQAPIGTSPQSLSRRNPSRSHCRSLTRDHILTKTRSQYGTLLGCLREAEHQEIDDRHRNSVNTEIMRPPERDGRRYQCNDRRKPDKRWSPISKHVEVRASPHSAGGSHPTLKDASSSERRISRRTR